MSDQLSNTSVNLNSLLETWQEFLTEAATSGRLLDSAKEALLLDEVPDPLKELISQWQEGDFSELPAIELLPASNMSGAVGAYARSNETIYLNEDWLTSASEESAIRVLTEELGHHLDNVVNEENTPGDEGAIFSSLALGEELTDRELETLRETDDTGNVTVEGEQIPVEQSTGVNRGELENVQEVFSTSGAFAALKEDGSVQTWGDSSRGGKRSIVEGSGYGTETDEIEDISDQLQSGVKEIFSTSGAFAALKEDGSVQAWGDSSRGGDLSGENSDFASGVPDGELENVQEIFSNDSTFAALKEDGSVQTWGDETSGGKSSIFSFEFKQDGIEIEEVIEEIEDVSNQLQSGVKEIFSTSGAFVALKADGSVQTWGDSSRGGDLSGENSDFASGVPDGELENVQEIFSTDRAFAALKEDGSVQAWGSKAHGGKSFIVETMELTVTNEIEDISDQLESGIEEIFSTSGAFVALKEDGSVQTWGSSRSGGDLSGENSDFASGVPDGELENVQDIFSNDSAFAALKEDGSVQTWGNSDFGGDLSGEDGNAASGVSDGELENVQEIFATDRAFAALKEDGSVQAWGVSTFGGDLSGSNDLATGVPDGKLENVQDIFSNDSAFAALKEDGSVETWGRSRGGGDLSGEDEDASGVPGGELENVQEIFATDRAFAALKEDGSIQTWGDSDSGGDLTEQEEEIEEYTIVTPDIKLVHHVDDSIKEANEIERLLDEFEDNIDIPSFFTDMPGNINDVRSEIGGIEAGKVAALVGEIIPVVDVEAVLPIPSPIPSITDLTLPQFITEFASLSSSDVAKNFAVLGLAKTYNDIDPPQEFIENSATSNQLEFEPEGWKEFVETQEHRGFLQIPSLEIQVDAESQEVIEVDGLESFSNNSPDSAGFTPFPDREIEVPDSGFFDVDTSGKVDTYLNRIDRADFIDFQTDTSKAEEYNPIRNLFSNKDITTDDGARITNSATLEAPNFAFSNLGLGGLGSTSTLEDKITFQNSNAARIASLDRATGYTFSNQDAPFIYRKLQGEISLESNEIELDALRSIFPTASLYINNQKIAVEEQEGAIDPFFISGKEGTLEPEGVGELAPAGDSMSWSGYQVKNSEGEGLADTPISADGGRFQGPSGAWFEAPITNENEISFATTDDSKFTEILNLEANISSILLTNNGLTVEANGETIEVKNVSDLGKSFIDFNQDFNPFSGPSIDLESIDLEEAFGKPVSEFTIAGDSGETIPVADPLTFQLAFDNNVAEFEQVSELDTEGVFSNNQDTLSATGEVKSENTPAELSVDLESSPSQFQRGDDTVPVEFKIIREENLDSNVTVDYQVTLLGEEDNQFEKITEQVELEEGQEELDVSVDVAEALTEIDTVGEINWAINLDNPSEQAALTEDAIKFETATIEPSEEDTLVATNLDSQLLPFSEVSFTILRENYLEPETTVDYEITIFDEEGEEKASLTKQAEFEPNQEELNLSTDLTEQLEDLDTNENKTFSVTLDNPSEEVILMENATTFGELTSDSLLGLELEEPTVEITSDPETAPVNFSIIRENNLDSTVTVDYEIEILDEEGNSIEQFTEQAELEADESEQEFSVDLLETFDELDTSEEKLFSVTLSNPSEEATLTEDATALGTTVLEQEEDDSEQFEQDSLLGLELEEPIVEITSDPETAPVNFSIIRDNNLDSTVTVDYEIEILDEEGNSIEQFTEQAELEADESEQEFSVDLLETFDELDPSEGKVFSVTLSNASEEATLAPNSFASGAITNDPLEITSDETVQTQEGTTEVINVETTGSEEVIFFVTGGDDRGFFTIDAETGDLSFEEEAPDSDEPESASGDNIYEVEVTAIDNLGIRHLHNTNSMVRLKKILVSVG